MDNVAIDVKELYFLQYDDGSDSGIQNKTFASELAMILWIEKYIMENEDVYATITIHSIQRKLISNDSDNPCYI